MVNENKRMYIPEENHQGKAEIYLRGPSKRSLRCPLSLMSRFGSAAGTGRGGRGAGAEPALPPLPLGAHGSPGRAGSGDTPAAPARRLLPRKARAGKSCCKWPWSPCGARGLGGAEPGPGLGGAAAPAHTGIDSQGGRNEGIFPNERRPGAPKLRLVTASRGTGRGALPFSYAVPHLSHERGGEGRILCLHTCAPYMRPC